MSRCSSPTTAEPGSWRTGPDAGAVRSGRPQLIYDGDCGFCRRCVDLGRARLGWFPDAVGYQWADLDDWALTTAMARRSVLLVRRGARPLSGHLAIAAVLTQQRSFRWRFAGELMSAPPTSWLAAAAYRLVARYRGLLPGSASACAATDPVSDATPACST